MEMVGMSTRGLCLTRKKETGFLGPAATASSAVACAACWTAVSPLGPDCSAPTMMQLTWLAVGYPLPNFSLWARMKECWHMHSRTDCGGSSLASMAPNTIDKRKGEARDSNVGASLLPLPRSPAPAKWRTQCRKARWARGPATLTQKRSKASLKAPVPRVCQSICGAAKLHRA